MARQTFTEGQRVYVKRWGTVYDAAIVKVPEVAKGYTGHKTYYVSVEYETNEHRRTGVAWEIINNVSHIITEAAYQELQASVLAARAARDEATERQQRAALDRYRRIAERIIELDDCDPGAPNSWQETLARALFVDFEPQSSFARRDRRKLVAKLTGDETPVLSLLPERDDEC